jgi:hypothetical protein
MDDTVKIESAFSAPKSFDRRFAERLEGAFNELREDKKILALHDWLCCRNCGWANMPDDFEEKWDGAVFYHHQATESASGTGVITLSWGPSREISDTAFVKRGETICESLMRHGLFVHWNGSPDITIAIAYSPVRSL